MKTATRVLILDDDRLIRAAVKRILEKSGNNYVVEELSNNSLLINMLKTRRFNCLIIDYFLADATGLDIIKQLSSLKIETPVIMMTGQGDELVAVKALKAGAYDYLPKSILTHNDAPEILTYTIQNAINTYNIKIERERTALSLQKNEERYRNLVEHSPMLILRFFPDDFMVSFVNDGFCGYFNTSRGEIIGDSVYKFLFENNPEKIDDINSITKENPAVKFDCYSENKDGIRWQLWTVHGLFDRLGKVVEYQCIGEDITPLKDAEKVLNNQKVFFQSILDSQENMIIVTDKKEILEANFGFLIFFGYRKLDDFKEEYSDIIELALDIPGYVTKADGPGWIDSILNGSKERLISFKPKGAPKAKIFSINISMLTLEKEVYVVTFSDVTDLEQKSKTFEEKASIDALTGIYNKDKFNEILADSIEYFRRYKTDLSVIFFDIDHFKNINDTYGHQVGDDVLREVVLTIKNSIRKIDVFARWGGEEFIVLMPQNDLVGSIQAAEKFRKNIMNHEFKTIKKLTCSFGVTRFTETDTADKFINRVDRALYKAKESGRNRVVGIKSGQ